MKHTSPFIFHPCHPACIQSFRAGSRGLALFVVALISFVSEAAVAPVTSPEHAFTIRQLELRKQQQFAASRSFRAFYGFQFTDRVRQSAIGFENRVVDDAAVSYKAAHYDHGNGVAVADVDGDGLPDLYFTTQVGTSQLWRNRGDGTFTDLTVQAGVGLTDQTVVAGSFADVDNDGDPDLFVTTVRHGNHMFENLGNGRFKDISKESGLDYSGHSSAATFFDYDRDGRLDLFVVNVGVYTTAKQGRHGFYSAYPDAFGGHLFPERTETSILYRNLGSNRFEDVSKQVGLQDGSWSGDAAFTDLNQDGFADLYIVNMQGDDHYYENQGGQRFVDKTAETFPKTPWGAMGVQFFDFNQDGLMDLYLTDMHSDMTQGQTVEALSFKNQAEKTKSEAYCSVQWTEAYLQGAGNNVFGNAFYQNQGGGKFVERSDSLGAETYWPWGVSVGDLNADGFPDVFVSAGMGYPFRHGINSVLLNEAGTRFLDSEFLLGVEPRGDGRTEKVWFTLECDGADSGHPECAGKTGSVDVLGTLSTRSSVIVDLDNDGDLDIVTNEFNDRPQVLISNLSDRKRIRFVKVKLIGTKSNRDGLGATVHLTTNGKKWTQCHDGKSGYLSQSSKVLYFGLGDATEVESIEVLWPSGNRQTVTQGIPANGLITITESAE
jgi:enediyne biosynthesis protein E4